MDLIKLSHLLKKWLEAKKDDINIDRSALVQSLENHYLTIMQEKLESLDDKYIDDTCHRYANVREQLSKRDFLNNQNPLKKPSQRLCALIQRYLRHRQLQSVGTSCCARSPHHQLKNALI